MRSLSPERSEADNPTCYDKIVRHKCRRRFLGTSAERASIRMAGHAK